MVCFAANVLVQLSPRAPGGDFAACGCRQVSLRSAPSKVSTRPRALSFAIAEYDMRHVIVCMCCAAVYLSQRHPHAAPASRPVETCSILGISGAFPRCRASGAGRSNLLAERSSNAGVGAIQRALHEPAHQSLGLPVSFKQTAALQEQHCSGRELLAPSL